MKLNIRKTKVIALFLTLILLVTSMPISAYAENSTGILTSYSPADQATEGCGIEPKADVEATTVLAEIVSRREENVKHFDIGNGLYQAVTYGAAVHRKDSNGVWQDIDNRLILNVKNNMYSTSDGRTRLSATANSSDPLISLSENGYTISMSPISNILNTTTMAEITNHEELNFNNVKGKSIEEVSSIRNDSSVRYRNVFASSDIEYILTSNDVKENIIVKSPQTSYTYSFALLVENLTVELQETGEIVFLDIYTNEIKYHIPAPYMYDSLGSVSHDVEYSLETVRNGYIITITADSSWLNNAERAFPVTIDPTIQKAIVFDTYISSANPTENYGSSSELWISPSRISFLRCSMPTIPSGCQFYAANLYVYYYYYSYITDGELYAGAYQVMHSWSENELTWNIAQPSSTTYISSTRLSTGYMSGARGAYSGSPKNASFDVTTAAASWYANPSSNFGIALKYQSGTNSSVILKSYEAGSEYRAYFVITYTEPQIISGVYRIKNAQNGLYLDTTGGGYSAGTEIQQWSRAESDTNRNQLFKITFVRTFGSTDQLNYYTIRPMTNNATGLESSLSGTERDVTIETMSTSDDWANLLYDHLWVISKNGSYYTIKNGRIADTSYLTAPSNTTNGETVFTSDTVTSYSKWVLERYTGEDLYGVDWQSFASNLIVGERYYYKGFMYDADVGNNGPIRYSVTNTDGSATDKATIDSYLGFLKALKPGQIRVRMTYDGAPWIWWWTVTITNVFSVKCYNNDSYWDVPNSQTSPYVECNDSGQLDRAVWVFVERSNGYYTIRNFATGRYLQNSGNTLRHEEYTGTTYPDSVLWKPVRQADGSYKIQSKSATSYYISEEDVSHSTQDPDIILSNTNDGVRQKWLLSPKTFSATVNNYFDDGYSVYYIETNDISSTNINTYLNNIAKRYYELFGIELTYTTNQYSSPIDECKGTVTSSNIDTLCTHLIKHTDRTNVIASFTLSHSGNNKTTSVYWSGHRIKSTATNGNINYNRSCSSGTCIIMIERCSTTNRVINSQGVLMHELNHQYGADDHYHELADSSDPSSCKFIEICSECGTNKRPKSCIMYQSRIDISASTVICDGCYADIGKHLNGHH